MSTETGTGDAVGDLVDGGGETVVGQHPRVDAAHRAAQVVERLPRPARCACTHQRPAPAPRRTSSSARPSVMVSATRRCWTPSCRSRSIRRRSVSNASTSSTRERRRSATAAASCVLARVEQDPGQGRPAPRPRAVTRYAAATSRRHCRRPAPTDRPRPACRSASRGPRSGRPRRTAAGEISSTTGSGHGEQQHHDVDPATGSAPAARRTRSRARTPAAGGRPAAARADVRPARRALTDQPRAGAAPAPPTAAAITGRPASTTAPTTTTTVATPTHQADERARAAWPARRGPWSARYASERHGHAEAEEPPRSTRGRRSRRRAACSCLDPRAAPARAG